MAFSKMIELLQKKDEGKIILINAGAFYIAKGKDAVLLHNILNLKVSCMEAEICKVGFPIDSLNKYTKLIEEKDYLYIVYNYNRDLGRLDIIKNYNGKKLNTIKENRLNCYICSKTVKMYKRHDKYIQAVADLYEKEYYEEKKKEEENGKQKRKRKQITINT